MRDESERKKVLGWDSAKGNYFQASVREELSYHADLMSIALTEQEIEKLAWGIAVELDSAWTFEPNGSVPPGYEPEASDDL